MGKVNEKALAKTWVTSKQVEAALAAFEHNRDVVKSHGFMSMLAALEAALAAQPATQGPLEVTAERAACLRDMERAWELRCGDYEPWPVYSDAAASHVFETLHQAVMAGAVAARTPEPAQGAVVWTAELAIALRNEVELRNGGAPMGQDLYEAGLAVGLDKLGEAAARYVEELKSQLETAKAEVHARPTPDAWEKACRTVDRLHDELRAANSERDKLEALFQQTHGVHWSWVQKGVELRAELKAANKRAESLQKHVSETGATRVGSLLVRALHRITRIAATSKAEAPNLRERLKKHVSNTYGPGAQYSASFVIDLIAFALENR